MDMLSPAPPVMGTVNEETTRSEISSSLWIVIVAVFEPEVIYAALSFMVMVTVSSHSARRSSMGVIETVADSEPEGIVTLSGMGIKSSPAMAEPEMVKPTSRFMLVLPVRLIVYMPDVGPASVAIGSVAIALTTGKSGPSMAIFEAT